MVSFRQITSVENAYEYPPVLYVIHMFGQRLWCEFVMNAISVHTEVVVSSAAHQVRECFQKVETLMIMFFHRYLGRLLLR